MLNLLEPTPSHWVEHAYADLPRLLSDHAHCELKAAQSALSLVGRYAGEAPELVEPLVALAKEETQHFNLVHQRIAALDEPTPQLHPRVRSYPIDQPSGRSRGEASR